MEADADILNRREATGNRSSGGVWHKVRRAILIALLTRRKFRAQQLEKGGEYYINGQRVALRGPHVLSLVMEVYWTDVYGLRRFKSLSTIVDIGANIGIFALCAKTRFPGSKVIAYEPSVAAASLLRQNLHGAEVEFHQEAVGDLGSQVFLEIGADSTAATVTLHESRSGVESQPCQMIPFDEVVQRAGGIISLLKLDCEGAEYGILSSASIRKVHNIAIEFHSVESGTPKSGMELLRSQGFRIDKWRGTDDHSNGIVWATNLSIDQS